MPDYELERLDTRSQSPVDERIAAVKELFPEAVREGKIDFEVLQRSLGEWIDPGKERFGLNWPGKAECMRLIQQPSVGTLVPDRESSVDFDTTQNVIIEGDNLEVLKLLQKSYHGKVKMIYIDPPYNTGKDFIYPDNYREGLQSYLEFSGQVDASGVRINSNTESNGRFHSRWLNMLYPRLYLARNLLTHDGLILVSINDAELANLLLVMNEIFSEESLVGTFVWQSKKGGGSDNSSVVRDSEYVVAYGRNSTSVSKLLVAAEHLDQIDVNGKYRIGRELNKWGSNSRRQDRPTMWFPIPGPNGEEVFPIRNDGSEGRWRLGKARMLELARSKDIEFERREDGTFIAYEKIRSTDPRSKPYRTFLTDVGTTADGSREVKELFDNRQVYDYPKPIKLLKALIALGTKQDDDLVLDFFAGSGTTAHAVMAENVEKQRGLRFILVQLPEPTTGEFSSIAEITRARVQQAAKSLRQQQPSEEVGDLDSASDFGYRAFRLVESNFTPWVGEPAQIPSVQEQLRLFTENIAHQQSLFGNAGERKRLTEALLTEVLLKAGYELTTPVEWLSLARNSVASVAEGGLLVCLDASISLDAIEAMVAMNPGQIVCLEAGFEGDDQRKVNALQLIRSRARSEDTTIAFKVV